jgi:hypothetical protein
MHLMTGSKALLHPLVEVLLSLVSMALLFLLNLPQRRLPKQ